MFSFHGQSVDINVFSFENPDANQAPPSSDDTANIRAYIDAELRKSPDFDENLYGDAP